MTIKRFEALDGISTNGEVIFTNTLTVSSNVAIDTNVLFINTATDRVGVGKLPTQGALDVSGNIHASAFIGDGSALTGIGTPQDSLVKNANNTYTNGRFTIDSNTTFVFTSNSILQLSDSRPLNFGTGGNVTLLGNTSGLFVSGSNVAIDTNVLFVDTLNNRIGVNTAAPTESLHVSGKIRIGTQATATTDAVRADRTLTAGVGMTGGGNLTANRTLTLTDIAAGSATVGALAYNTTTRAAGKLYGGTTNPTSTTRLNYDGNLHVTNLTSQGDVNTLSDQRLKNNITTISGALDSVKLLRGVRYIKDDKESIGLIAQEVLQVIPEVVNTTEEYYSVSYGNLIALLIEAVKELSDKLDK